ncbi:MAG TPA: c-type cytochrome domain-containing protein [Tepidisphaeraceae bacterium]|nr:c-type cytochrome domain-containing protein [Tepidisphaeraceae bacterium]
MTKCSIFVFLAIAPALATTAFAQEKITYQDHVLPIFRNSCFSCHNADKKKADLDLSSFAAALAGGGSGKALEPGSPEGSLLYRLVTHAEEPQMPPKGGKLPDKDLNTIKMWIAGGLLENSGSVAMVSNKPKLDLSVSVNDSGKPDGPPPMPGDLLLEPVMHTPRAGAITALAASPWAPLVAIGGQKQVLLYNPKTQDLLGVLPFPDGQPNVLRFARSGKLLLAGGGEGAKSGKVALYDITTGQRVTELGEEFDAVLAADITSDQSLVALGGPSRVVKIFNVATGAAVKQIKKHTDWITAVAYSPDTVLLATGDRAGNLHVWETRSGNAFYTLAGHKQPITDLCYRGDSNVLASASEDGAIRLWDMYTGTTIKEIKPAHPGGVLSLHFTHDGRLVSSGRDRRVRVWKPDGSPASESEPFKDIVLRAAFNEDGTLAIGGDWNGEIRVISAADAKPLGVLDINPPKLATRIALAEKRLAELRPAHEKLAAELTAAREAETKANAELQQATQAAAAGQKAVADATAALAAANGTQQSIAAQVQASQDALAAAKAEAERLAQARVQAIATRDGAAAAHVAAAEVAACAQAESDAAIAVASRIDVLQRFAQMPILDGALALAQQHSEQTRQSADEAEAAVEPLAQQLQPLVDAVAKAEADLARAQNAVAAAQQLVAQAQASVDQGAAQIAALTQTLTKTRADAEAATQHATAKTAAAQATGQALAKLQPLADEAAATLAAAQAELSKWQAATVNVALLAAKQELADRTAEHAALAEALKQADAALAKATADVAATDKQIADSPAHIAAVNEQLAKSRQALALATKTSELMTATLTERSGLAKRSAELVATLRETAAKSPDNPALAAAAAKAQESLDLLSADLASAQAAGSAAAATVQQATAEVAAHEAALAEAQSDAQSLPAALAQQKQTAATASTAAVTAKAATDAAAQTTAAAKAKVETLSTEYARLKQQSAPQVATANP